MSDEPQETSYYLRLLSMYMDLGTEIVLDVFVYHSPGQDAEMFLKSKQNMIVQLKNDHILNGQECSMLLQQGKDVVQCRLDIKSFDISLLITLSRNLLTARELAPPVKGWECPPRNNDKSVAADLLRLKKIRNVIVGHHPRAGLPLWRFENVWDEVSEILIRLQQHIAPGKEVHLQARIEAYRLQRLDPTVKNKYDAKLKQWHNEVTTMQDQVDELIKKLGGFEAYFNSKSDRFERYTKLLFKGGHFVLSAFLDKKIKDEGKDLRTMLTDNKDDIRKVISDKEQLDKLYPCNPPSPTGPIDTSSWTVSLLATVMLQLFSSAEDKGVILNIKKIGEAYGNYANATLLALDSNAFEDYWTDLKTSIHIVAYRLDERQSECCYQILEECKKQIDEKEFKTYMEELKAQGTQIKSFTETYKDVLQRTKDFLQDMTTHGISFKNAQVLELKMITLGTDEQQKKLAEEILIAVWNEALDRAVQSTNFVDVKKEVLKILEELKKSESVENISVRAKCILLQVKCTSPCAMLNMIEYFQSRQFHESIRNISIELGYFLDTIIDVYSVITVECLWRIYSQTDETEHFEEGGLSLQMTVTSPAGMKDLISLCSQGTIANCTNSIADALSKHLGCTIGLKAVADMKEFKHVFDTDSSSSDSCSDYSSMESNVQDINYFGQIHTDRLCNISEGLTIKGSTNAELSQKELNKHIDGTTYALKSLNLTTNETDYKSDYEKQTMSLVVEEIEGNSTRCRKDLEVETEKIIKDEKREETDETLRELDEGLKDKVKEEAIKEQQDFKDSPYQGTSPVRRKPQRYVSDEPKKTLSSCADSEETLETIALLELCQSQIAVAQNLDLAYYFLQHSPDIAREIISTSQFAKDAHEAMLSYDTFGTHLFHLIKEIKSLLSKPHLSSRVLQYAEKVRDETEESKKRYITLQTYVQRNIQQVEHTICSEKESGVDEHTFKGKIGVWSKNVRSQHIFTPDVTGKRKFKDVNEENLHKTSKGFMDIDLMDINARKMKVEVTVLFKLRPGLTFTGGIASIVLMSFDCYNLFTLISNVNKLDLQDYADWIKKDCTDTQLRELIDHIVIQRRKQFDRLETIQKQEKNKGLEFLKEVTRHLKNIDTQFTRMMNCWSELADDIEFLLKNEAMAVVLKHWDKYDLERRHEWTFVMHMFSAYAGINCWSVYCYYSFVSTVEEKKELQKLVRLKKKEETTHGYVSKYKRSGFESLMSKKADKRFDLKSPMSKKADKRFDLKSPMSKKADKRSDLKSPKSKKADKRFDLKSPMSKKADKRSDPKSPMSTTADLHSSLKSPMGEMVDIHSDTKSLIGNTGKQENITRDEEQKSKYEHWWLKQPE